MILFIAWLLNQNPKELGGRWLLHWLAQNMKITGVSGDGRRCGKQEEEIMINVYFQFVVNQQQQLASLDKFQLGPFLGKRVASSLCTGYSLNDPVQKHHQLRRNLPQEA